jgi:hypothetical protein
MFNLSRIFKKPTEIICHPTQKVSWLTIRTNTDPIRIYSSSNDIVNGDTVSEFDDFLSWYQDSQTPEYYFTFKTDDVVTGGQMVKRAHIISFSITTAIEKV